MGLKYPVFPVVATEEMQAITVAWLDAILARRLQYPFASISELQGELVMQNLIKTIATLLITFLVFVGCGEMVEVEFDNGKFSAAEFSAEQGLERTAEHTYADTAGAGIYVKGSSLTIVDSNFTDNISAGRGGAIYAENSQLSLDCTFTNSTSCEISRNSAQVGGALYLDRVGSNGNPATIKNTLFRTNTAHLMYDFEADIDDDGELDGRAPAGMQIAIADNGEGGTYVDIDANYDNSSDNQGFKYYNGWGSVDKTHWRNFTPYVSGNEDAAHIALLTDAGELFVNITNNTVHACDGTYCQDDDVNYGAPVGDNNRFLRCTGFDNDGINYSGNELDSGETDYGCS